MEQFTASEARKLAGIEEPAPDSVKDQLSQAIEAIRAEAAAKNDRWWVGIRLSMETELALLEMGYAIGFSKGLKMHYVSWRS